MLMRESIVKSLIVAWLLAGCAGQMPKRELEGVAPVLGATSATGWLDSTGEWTLFPRPRPRPNGEPLHCVNVVNDTGQPRSKFDRFDGRRVRITGMVVRYDELSEGEAAADKYLNRRYWKDEKVFNACLSPLVMVAKSIEAAPRN